MLYMIQMPIGYPDMYVKQGVGICCFQEKLVLEIRIQESAADREY